MSSTLKRLVWSALLLLATGVSAGEWNGVGEIEKMYIYPTYAVVVQGNSGQGAAGCANDKTWSFEWSQFDVPTQNRIQSMLLSAYTTNTAIQVVVETNACGPEGKKKFTGQINLP